MKDRKRPKAENMLIAHNVGVRVCVRVQCLCVSVFISHFCLAVYCCTPVDHQCVLIFKMNNKAFVTKMFLSLCELF